MSARFHISKDGKPRSCSAQPGDCRLGGKHYDSMKEANLAAMQAELDDASMMVRGRAAANPKTAPETLAVLAGDLDLRLNVAMNPSTPSDVLEGILACPNDTDVWIEALSNPNLNDKWFEDLYEQGPSGLYSHLFEYWDIDALFGRELDRRGIR